MKTYYNTNREMGGQLAESRSKARSQQEKVLDFFRANRNFHFTVHYINRVVLPDAPHHSAQRAITNLTDAGYLLKTNRMVEEKYGKKVHTWRLKPSGSEQILLFPG